MLLHTLKTYKYLPPQLKLQSEVSTFINNKISESGHNKKIHKNNFYEILVLFPHKEGEKNI